MADKLYSERMPFMNFNRANAASFIEFFSLVTKIVV